MPISTASSIPRMPSRSNASLPPIPALAAERDRIEALRRLIGERLPREAPAAGSRSPDRGRRRHEARALRGRLGRRLPPPCCSRFHRRRRDLVRAAPRSADAMAEMVVASHMRALDGAAADRRQLVRPPHRQAVVQRAHPRGPACGRSHRSTGFPLVGGRIDVIGRIPVPTLVYRHRQHLDQPDARCRPAGTPIVARARDRRLQHSDLDRRRHRLLGGLRPRGERSGQLRQGISRGRAVGWAKARSRAPCPRATHAMERKDAWHARARLCPGVSTEQRAFAHPTPAAIPPSASPRRCRETPCSRARRRRRAGDPSAGP